MTISEQAVEAALATCDKSECCFADTICTSAPCHCVEQIIRAAQPLMGVMRREDVARARELATKLMRLADGALEYPDDEAIARDAADMLVRFALPHPGQPQEGDERLRIHEMRVTVSSIFQLARDAPPNAKTLKAIREAAERALTRDASKAAAPQAGCAKEGDRELREFLDDVITSHEFLDGKGGERRDGPLGRRARKLLSSLSASPPPPVAESGWQLSADEQEMFDGALDVAVQLATSTHEQHKGLGQIIAGVCAIIHRRVPDTEMPAPPHIAEKETT